MTSNELTNLCISKLNIAIKKFGEYTFFDKGPSAVMNISELSDKFLAVGVEDTVTTLKKIINTDDKYGEALVSAIVMQLEDWQELWEKHSEFLRKYY